ncbi:MAG: hypothetical protein V4724_32455 [Pseudomonadota bacterium]
MRLWLPAAMLALLAGPAASNCVPIRYGYTNQSIPPYYIGSGVLEAHPPGAVVDLVREAAASIGCGIETSRLPPARIKVALGQGMIDLGLLFESDQAEPNVAFPLDKNGRVDAGRGLQLFGMVFVRAADQVARDSDPAAFLKQRRIGVSRGASYVDRLRGQGYRVDDGAANVRLNLEKLLLNRIDACLIALPSPDGIDAVIAERFGTAVVRLDKPMLTSTTWLGLSKDYHERHRVQAEALWDWFGTNGRARLGALMRQYENSP